uniref:EamA domain-containing protein n=1 Tax=Vitrella brassicaformis TaxID=1169539 RepID=A0A7S1KB26_9ALVE|mmetsp:Transcript_45312/g.112553  ORF Transcript_45312/g.112553 Transcript_45312/m.112553 type:complete len:382 (+) Transcript_45312:139-1284(+)
MVEGPDSLTPTSAAGVRTSADIDMEEATAMEDPATPSEDKGKKEKAHPSELMLHGALIFAQVLFGGGAVVGKLGMPKFNPVLFALIREAIAGPILLLIAIGIEKNHRIPPVHRHWRTFLLTGLFLFGNQFCYLVGLKMADETSAASWQPSQPIMTVILAIIVGQETMSPMKGVGISLGTLGAVVLVVAGAPTPHTQQSWRGMLVGNMLFFVNCLSTSLYLVASKPLLQRHRIPSPFVIAFSYMNAAVMMLVAALIVNLNKPFLELVCPDCPSAWGVPPDALWALAYWVIGSSVTTYLLMTWANKYVDGSMVAAYTVLQPVTAVLLTCLLVVLHLDPTGALSLPSWNALGGIAVVIGLGVLVYDSRQVQSRPPNAQVEQPPA